MGMNMTRINLVDPKDLTNRHLVAEYKEITQFMHLIKKRIDDCKPFDDIPSEYTLNGGHCRFFYDKGLYIRKRFISLYSEIVDRGMNTDKEKYFNRLDKIDSGYREDLMNDYYPSKEDYRVAIDRISSRINEKIHLYPDSSRFLNSINKYIG